MSGGSGPGAGRPPGGGSGPPLRVAVVGAGGIGSVLAAASVDAGHQVTVCVRTPIDALTVERDGSERDLAVAIARDPGAIEAAADVVWFAPKIMDTAAACGWLVPLCAAGTVVAVAQNGLDHASRLTGTDGATVVPALAYIAAEKLDAGRVRHIAGDRVVVPAGTAAATLARAVEGSRLTVRGSDDIVTETWRKLLGNLVANPVTALTLRRIAVVREPGIHELGAGILREAVEVARAEGARIDAADAERVLSGMGQYGDRTGSSMLYDRLAGRPLEHQALTGEVVRRAARHGIPVPLNAAVLALLDAIDRDPDARRAAALVAATAPPS